MIVQHVSGCGELLSHHVLFVLSLIGLLPDCVCSYAKFASSTSTGAYLNETLNLFVDDEYVKCSYHALKAVANHLKISMMEAENVSCKLVQSITGSSNKWRYSLSPNQLFIFHYDASLGKIVSYAVDGMVYRIHIDCDWGSIQASDQMKNLKGSKKCLKEKQTWKGKKHPPIQKVITRSHTTEQKNSTGITL